MTTNASMLHKLLALALCGLAVLGGVSAQADVSSPVIPPPPGLLVSGPPEAYQADTLFEKINGQAGLYLSAGFVDLKSQWYQYADDPGRLIEVNIYNMGSLLNAFSVYSRQQRENAKKIDITPFAYLTANAIFLVHGPYYLEVLASDIIDTETSPEIQLARQFIKATHVEETTIKALEWFPSENMEKGSMAMIPKDAFGLADFDRVFTAGYVIGDSRMTAYVSDRGNSQAALALMEAVYRHFKSFGGSDDQQPGGSDGNSRLIEVMGTYEFVFATGPFVAGIHEAESRSKAEELGNTIRSYLTK